MTLPSEPGAYLDGGGDVWIRTKKGVWFDSNGDCPPVMTDEALNWLEGNGPYTPMPRSVMFVQQYRVCNKEENFESEEYNLLEEANLWIEKDSDYVEERIAISVPWNKVKPETEVKEDGTTDDEE